MRANPGGQIDPRDVVGRDRIISYMWRTLESQSVVLTAARRMGKTSIIKKMAAEPVEGFYPVYHELEGIRSPSDFADSVYHDAGKFLSTKAKATNHVATFLKSLGGAEAAGVKLPSIASVHWRTVLEKIGQDLAENQEGILVFFWDEMPMMLENIRADHGATTAMQVLDVLRALRQTYPKNIRMVYTGSVGLHHVISTLKQQKYVNSPLNDMLTIDVPPLAPVDAHSLAASLLEGEQIETDNKSAMARNIAEKVDNVAFYIHHVVGRLALKFNTVEPTDVDKAIQQLLLSPEHWDMTHYRERINVYYSAEDVAMTLAVLDALAVNASSLPYLEVAKQISSRVPATEGSDEQLHRILDALRNDHYLVRDDDGSYRFYLPLIKRWWRTDRELGTKR